MNLTPKNIIIALVLLLTMGALAYMSYSRFVGGYEAEELTQFEQEETASAASKKHEGEVSHKANKSHEKQAEDILSPYTGEENRPIKALSSEDVAGLRSGSGMIFNGLAKAAELNGYPGPRHVLEAYEAGSFDLSDRQLEEVQKVFEEMQVDAIKAGERLLSTEEEIDTAFDRDTIFEYNLQRKVMESAEFYGQLRFIHLRAHLQMMDILTPEQVQLYSELRGYSQSANQQDSEKMDHHSNKQEKHRKGH